MIERRLPGGPCRTTGVLRRDAVLGSVVAALAVILAFSPPSRAGDGPDILARARSLFDTGDRDAAIELLRKEAGGARADGAVVDTLAQLLLEAGYAEQAVPYLRRIESERPDDSAVKERLALAYEKSGHPTQAALVVDRLSRLPGAPPDLLERLARLHEAAGKPSEAAAALDRLLAHTPRDVALLLRIAALRVQLGHLRDARVAYETIAALRPREAAPLRAVGQLRAAVGEMSYAVDAYEKANKLEPNHPKTLRQLADLYGWTDRPLLRVDTLRALLRTTPGDVEAREALARTLLERGLLREAADELALVVRARPERDELRILLAEVCLWLDRFDEAAELLEEVRSRDPANGAARRVLAQVLEARGDRLAALNVYREVLALAPADPSLRKVMEDLDLEVAPRVSARYGLLDTRLGLVRHTAAVWFEHEPLQVLRYRAGYAMGYSTGSKEADRVSATAQSHGGFLGATLRLAPRTLLDLELGLQAYTEGEPFAGGGIVLTQAFQTPLRLELSARRLEVEDTIEAIDARSSSNEVGLEVEWEPVSRWLLEAGGRFRHIRHDDHVTGETRGNNAGAWFAGTGVRLLHDPLELELMGDYTGEAHELHGTAERIPYFSSALYQTVGLRARYEHRPHWRFRYVLHARPHWAFVDEALLMTYGVDVEVKLHRRHFFQVAFDRTDTLYGEATVIYAENVLMATYTGVF